MSVSRTSPAGAIPMQQPQMTRRQWLMLGLLALLWGGSFLAIGVAVSVLPPFTVVFLRVAFAALTLLAYMRITGVPLPGIGTGQAGKIWLALITMGFLNNLVPFSLIVWGQTQIASSLAAILNATMPLFTVFVAHFFIATERLTPRRFLGVLVGFSGVVLIIGPDALSGLDGSVFGKLAILGAALSYAVAVVVGRRFVTLGLKPVQMAFGQVAAAAFVILPVTLSLDHPLSLPMPPATVWLALISLSVISTAVAYLLYFRLIAEAGATNASMVTLLIPVVATLLGIGLLGERVLASHLGGLALIGLGLMVLDGRLVRLFRGR